MTDRTLLPGSVALVTGSAERVGLVIARALASAGMRVVINHWGQSREARQAVGEIERNGGQAIALEADIGSPQACRELIDAVDREFGRLDLLVHNASSFVQRPFLEVTEEDFDRSFNVNLRGPFFLSQAAARLMLRQGNGKIIAIAGNSLYEAWPDFLPHAMSKAALARMTQLLAVALSPTVQSIAIAPAEMLATGSSAKDDGARSVDGIDLVTGRPEDLAEMVVLLAASTSYLNGSVIPLDGAKSLV